MLITEAYAQAAGASAVGGLDNLGQFLPLILIFIVFYFLLMRPQQQKQKKHREMVNALRRGDRVITQAGIFGTVNKVISETELLVEIAENVKVRMAKSAVTEVLSKTEPVKAEGEAATSEAAPAADAAKTDDSKPSSLLGKLLGKK